MTTLIVTIMIIVITPMMMMMVNTRNQVPFLPGTFSMIVLLPRLQVLSASRARSGLVMKAHKKASAGSTSSAALGV